MKNTLSISFLKIDTQEVNLKGQINFLAAVILVFSVPLSIHVIPYIIILWILTWIIEGNQLSKIRYRLQDKPNRIISIIFLSYYLLHVVSLIYSDNLEDGLFDIQVKLSLCVFPVVLLGSNKLYEKKFHWIIFGFISGNLVASIICLSNALINSISLEDGSIIFNLHPNGEYWNNNFLYKNLSILQQPSYFALFLTSGIGFLFYLIEKKIMMAKLRIYYWSCIVFFTLIIFLLSSRAGILSWFIISSIYLIYKFSSRKNIQYKFGIILSMIILISFFALIVIFGNRFSILYKRVTSAEKSEQVIATNDLRIRIWYVAGQLVRENILIGVGTGDVKDALVEKYHANGFVDLESKSLNAHNQFLESFIGLGLPGLTLLGIIFIYPFFFIARRDKYLLGVFLFIVGINFLFESMLNRLAGVVFFSFFYNYFVLLVPLKEADIGKNNDIKS